MARDEDRDGDDRRRDPTGRFAPAEIDVAASPEEVWEAIATRHGTGAWMFATEIEGREGGAVLIHRRPFGPDAVARVTAWDPPHRLAYEEPVEAPDGSGGPPLATEYLVKTSRGGTCIVRVVTGMHHGGDEWEDLIEGTAEGWRMALVVLRSYLTHFAGQPGQHIDVISPLDRPPDESPQVFAALKDRLGVSGLDAGDPFRVADRDAPRLAGTIEHAAGDLVVLRTSEPCPGLVAISTLPMDGATLTVNVTGRLYGHDAATVAEHEQPRWAAWLAELFPGPATTPRSQRSQPRRP